MSAQDLLLEESLHKSHHELWKNVSRDLIVKFGDAVFRSWFSKIFIVGGNNNSIVLGVTSRFIRDWIKTNYIDIINRLCQQHAPEFITIDLIVSSQTDVVATQVPDSQVLAATECILDETSYQIFNSQLDPRFTFETFVVGNPNELAYAVAKTVAESKKAIAKSNPLFLYGGVGLGKTHLMHAMAWHMKQSTPGRKVIYMSAEKFMYQFVKALRNKDIMVFKEQFRSVDVLMIDDIQFISGKESTQEEFFHTFNALIDNSRQMVISCDRSPTDLNNVEERIKSRLGWGLVADVHSTTYELRLGILQSKIGLMNSQVPNNVVEFLAAKITSNVRELEGALNKVIAHSTLVGSQISLESTQEILRDLLRFNERCITIEDIQKKVAEQYSIRVLDMSSDSRQRSVARPRQIAMYLAKLLTTKSLCDIGKKFGKKDHTTVLHACKQIEKLTIYDLEVQEEVKLLVRILQG